MKFSIFFIFFLPMVSAHAQDASPLSRALPGVLNEDSGCGRGRASEAAKNYCSTFTEGKYFSQEPTIRNAYQKCQAFYAVAFRLQNTFCSYSTTSVIFKITSEAKAQEKIVGEARVSQEVVSKENRKISDINKTYMSKFSTLRESLISTFQDYARSLYQLQAEAGRDMNYESQCSPKLTTGKVPGYLRGVLASYAFASGKLTFESMSRAVRDNYKELKEVKDTADYNWKLAEMNAIESGVVIKDVVEKKPEPADPEAHIKLETLLDKDSFSQMAVSITQMLLKKYGVLIERGAGIVGGAAITGFRKGTDHPVDVVMTGISLVSVLSPAAGLGLSFLVLTSRINDANLEKYQSFCVYELAKDMNLTSAELVAIWGRRTDNPSCAIAAGKQKACDEKRANPVPYDHSGDCIPGPTENATRRGTFNR